MKLHVSDNSSVHHQEFFTVTWTSNYFNNVKSKQFHIYNSESYEYSFLFQNEKKKINNDNSSVHHQEFLTVTWTSNYFNNVKSIQFHVYNSESYEYIFLFQNEKKKLIKYLACHCQYSFQCSNTNGENNESKCPAPGQNMIRMYTEWGPGSSVGIAAELLVGRSGDRIPVGLDFPPVQTGPGAHTASWTMGTVSFLEVKCGRDVLLTTHPLLVPWSWKCRTMPVPTLWATTGPATGTHMNFRLQRVKLFPYHIQQQRKKRV